MLHGNDRVAEIKVIFENQTPKFTTLITHSANTKETVFLRVHTRKENLKQLFPCFTDRLSSFPWFLRITLTSTEALSQSPMLPRGGSRRRQPVETRGKAVSGLRAYNGGLCSWSELGPRPHNGAL